MSAGAVETTVTDGYLASIPADVRRELDIEPGDKLVWSVEDGGLQVRVRKRRERAFEDFEPFDLGEDTHASQDHDEVAR